MLKRTLVPLFAAALLAACGNEEKPAAPPATEAPAQAPAASAPQQQAAAGEGVYKQTCFLCHGTGAGGAPMLTDKADWERRLAQGVDTLYKHALEGYTGTKGVMPPKGGNPSLSDDNVKAAVDYMTAQVR